MWLSLLLYFTNKKIINKKKDIYIKNNISLIRLMIAEENIIRSKLDEIVDKNINIYILIFFSMDKCID
mgnify:CR=1 FL=1